MNQSLRNRIEKLEKQQVDATEPQRDFVVADLSELTPTEMDIALNIGGGVTAKDCGPMKHRMAVVSEEDLEKLSPEQIAVVRKLVESAAKKAVGFFG